MRRPFALKREPKRHALAWAGELDCARLHHACAVERASVIENADGCRFTTPQVAGLIEERKRAITLSKKKLV